MIYVRITEGLGNQFYKYAFAYSLMSRNNEKLLIDTAGYKFDPRSFALDRFCIDAETVCLAEPKKNSAISKLAARIKRRFQIGFGYQYIIEDPSMYYQYQEPACKIKKTVYIQGYWQNYKYFCGYEAQIRKQFQLKNVSEKLRDYCREVKNQESVAIHIRMGDYRIKDRLNPEYYIKALNYIQSIGKTRIYVFCEKDDLNNVRGLFESYAPIYVAEKYPDLDDIESFELMKSCKNQIISNSTYSWWAAWLNENQQKVVIAPLIDRLNTEYYPKDWILLDACHERE